MVFGSEQKVGCGRGFDSCSVDETVGIVTRCYERAGWICPLEPKKTFLFMFTWNEQSGNRDFKFELLSFTSG